MSRRASGNLQHQAEHTRSRRSLSVMGYLLILFVVAFLLLALAYFQQRRANSETSDALKQSASAVQSIQNLMEDNENLRNQVASLQQELEDAQNTIAQLQADNASDEKSVLAMQWFWQIDDYYVRGAYWTAKKLIEEFEAQEGLVSALPTENETGTDRFSPAKRYEEIYNALF